MTLGLHLLTRNGGVRALRAVASVREHLAELVVVDTGSTDDTREMLRRYFADASHPRGRFELVSCTPGTDPEAFLADAEGTWSGIAWSGLTDAVTGEQVRRELAPYSGRQFLADFGHARRRGWDRHEADHVTYLDSDDVWKQPELIPELLAGMVRADAGSAALPYVYRRDSAGRVTCQHLVKRVVRRSGGRWEGRMHERLDADGLQARMLGFGEVEDLDDLRDPDSRVAHRGLKALLRFWADGDAGSPHDRYALAMEARRVLPDLALELLSGVARESDWAEQRGKSYLEAGLIREGRGDLGRAWECHVLAGAADPRSPDPAYALARMAHFRGEHRECVRLTELGDRLASSSPSVLQWNPQARGAWPSYLCAASLQELGRAADARERLLPHLGPGAPPEIRRLATLLGLEGPPGAAAARDSSPALGDPAPTG